ncbi:MAG: hypothetical protein ABIY70_19930 [Capsulimonas sp.]|uniref:hypothetical protein n=1 Tax=Capsulimonas sp. TaxID=2494211 RepID=UPI003262FCCF
MSEKFTRGFLRIWITAATMSASAWLWRHFPLGLLMIATTALLIRRAILKERRRRQKEGYWLEFLSPGVLRGDDDEFAVVYHEGGKQKFFTGKIRQREQVMERVRQSSITKQRCKHIPKHEQAFPQPRAGSF